MLPPEEEQKDLPVAPQSSQQGTGIGNGVEHLLSHVQAALASTNANTNTGTSMVAAAQPPSDPRAELQAQLALLAAQLAELAQTDEGRVGGSLLFASAGLTLPQSQQLRAPAASVSVAPMHSLSDTPSLAPQSTSSTTTAEPTQLPAPALDPSAPGSLPQAVSVRNHEVSQPPQTQENEGSSDDDDMEEVI